MKPAAILLLAALAGCTSYADRVAGYCLRLADSSDHYWDCIHQQQEIDQRDRAMWAGVAVSGAALSSYRPASTTCTTFGNVTHCSGY